MTPSCHGVASTVHAGCPARGVACPFSLTPLQRSAAKFFAQSLHFWDGYNFSYDFVHHPSQWPNGPTPKLYSLAYTVHLRI